MKYTFTSLLFLLTLILHSCSVLQKEKKPLGHTPLFKKIYNETVSLLEKESIEEAYQKIKQVKEVTLANNDELISYYYLLGLIFKEKKQYAFSIGHFQNALLKDKEELLKDKIYLEIAICYFLKGEIKNSFQYFYQIKERELGQSDQEKMAYLRFDLYKGQNDLLGILDSSWKLFSIFKKHPFGEQIQDTFFKLSFNDQMNFFKKYLNSQTTFLGELVLTLASQLHFSGNKNDSYSLVDWATSLFDKETEIGIKLRNFKLRFESNSNLNLLNVGVLFPFSGKGKNFAFRALNGINFALKEWQKKNPYTQITIYLKDSQENNTVSSLAIKELIEDHKVSIIIGGLFPEEGKEQYLSAKNSQCFFVSLSELTLPNKDKNFLLLELPGPIQGLAKEALFQIKEMARKKNVVPETEGSNPNSFSERTQQVALVFPENEVGKIFAEEFFQHSLKYGLKVGGAYSFDENNFQPEEIAKDLLGIKWEKEREEEYFLWKQLQNEMERQKYAARKRREFFFWPRTDFDYLYIFSNADQALQIISRMEYVETLGPKYFGGPSWRSSVMLNNIPRSADNYFLSDDIQSIPEDLKQQFQAEYKTFPKLLELRAMDGLNIYLQILSKHYLQTPLTANKALPLIPRHEFNERIVSEKIFQGITGLWQLENDLWYKKLGIFKIEKNTIKSLKE